MRYTKDNNFWYFLDELLVQSKIIIDRPKGSAHPHYPQIVYQLDYGYLDGTRSSDSEGIDVWIGSESDRRLNAVMSTVDLVKKDTELKLLIGCTQEEKAYINSFYNEWPQMGGILVERDDSKTL